MKNHKSGNSSWEYDDDCPVCQAMRIADEAGREPTAEELLESFEAAKIITPHAGTFEDLTRNIDLEND